MELVLLAIMLFGILIVVQLIFLFFIILHGKKIEVNRTKTDDLKTLMTTHEVAQEHDMTQYGLRTYHNDTVLRERQRKLENAVFGS